jgi:acyl carrier protein
MVREDERGGKRLLGYVVGEAGVTAAELKRRLKEKLPEYMVPEAIILLAEMPLTVNGKIDRRKLHAMKDAGAHPEQKGVASRTPVEELVAGIFEDLLKLDRVGIHDNFFDIGGHSLLATQVVSRIRDVFEVSIGVRRFFEGATVAGLAAEIEAAMRRGEKNEAPPLVRASRNGHRGARLPLSFAQQRLWFLDQLAPNNPFYNFPGAVRLDGWLDLNALERVINEIVRRHEVLRTRLEIEAGQPVQVVDAWESTE